MLKVRVLGLPAPPGEMVALLAVMKLPLTEPDPAMVWPGARVKVPPWADTSKVAPLATAMRAELEMVPAAPIANVPLVMTVGAVK